MPIPVPTAMKRRTDRVVASGILALLIQGALLFFWGGRQFENVQLRLTVLEHKMDQITTTTVRTNGE